MRRLAAVNPVSLSEMKGLANSPSARELLERIVSEPPTERPTEELSPKGRRRSVWAGTAAVLAAVGLLVTQFVTGADHEPRARAADALNAVAAVAAGRPPALGAGEYRYMKMQFTDRVTSEFEGSLWTVLVPSTDEIWVAADGSGRVRSVTGEPIFLGERDRAL